jgi:predicted nucleotidyltransferase
MDTREEIINKLRQFFEEKALHYGLELVFLYGSWARGFPKEESDIDIAVVFSEGPISDDELFRAINDISLSSSEDLGRDVNIVILRPDFREPMLYYNAIILGIPVFVKNAETYINIKNEAIYHMEDFSLFGIDWQLRNAKKNLEDLEHA